MNEHVDFERLVAGHIADEGTTPPSDAFYDELFARAGGSGQRPEWLALIKESPMRTNSHLAVGSPTVRLAAIVAATMLLAVALAAAGAGAQRLFAAGDPVVVAQDGSGDYETVGEAVAAASDGDTILVRPGTYDESIVLDKDVTIRGDGDRDKVILESSVEMPPGGTHNPPSLPTAFLFEASNAVIEDLTLRGISSRVVIDGGAPKLRGLVFEGVGKVWLNNDPSAPAGLVIDNGSTALLEDSVIVDTDIGIRSGSSPTIVGNEITTGAIFMVEEAAPVIRENTIAGSQKWAITVWQGATPEIVDNTIVDNLNGIVVEDSGTHPTLRGNRISGSGSKGISVVTGADATIDGNELTDNATGISAYSSDATIVGNTVSGGGIGITVALGSPTLDGNDVEGAERGLVIGNGASPTLTDNTVCGNETNLWLATSAEMPDTSGNEICEDAAAE